MSEDHLATFLLVGGPAHGDHMELEGRRHVYVPEVPARVGDPPVTRTYTLRQVWTETWGWERIYVCDGLDEGMAFALYRKAR